MSLKIAKSVSKLEQNNIKAVYSYLKNYTDSLYDIVISEHNMEGTWFYSNIVYLLQCIKSTSVLQVKIYLPVHVQMYKYSGQNVNIAEENQQVSIFHILHSRTSAALNRMSFLLWNHKQVNNWMKK